MTINKTIKRAANLYAFATNLQAAEYWAIEKMCKWRQLFITILLLSIIAVTLAWLLETHSSTLFFISVISSAAVLVSWSGWIHYRMILVYLKTAP